MARRRYTVNEKRAARFEKEGRGQGTGEEYKPWLTIQEVPSRGRSHRMVGITARIAESLGIKHPRVPGKRT